MLCFCGKKIEESTRAGGKWVHTETGSVKCRPEAVRSDTAAPSVAPPGNRMGR